MKARKRMGQVAVVAAILSAILSLLSCTERGRHATLAFFFDGVPSIDQASAAGAGPNAAPGARKAVPAPVQIIHRRMDRKDCSGCHNGAQGFQPTYEVSLQVCDRCHGARRVGEGWNHGPLNLGQCLPCHTSGHGSGNPHLLSKPVQEICLYCHDREDLDKNINHRIAGWSDGEVNCLGCHKPHKV